MFFRKTGNTQIVYETVAEAVCNVRACRQLQAEWSKEIDKDWQEKVDISEKKVDIDEERY